MSYLSYALPVTDYTLRNALLWGNCSLHFEKSTHGTWGKRAVHALICLIELPPVISQIASLFEMVIAKYLIERFRKFTQNLPVSPVKVITPIITEQQKKVEETQNESPKDGAPAKQSLNLPDAPISMLDSSPVDSQNQQESPGPSPSSSQISDTPSTDSETPVSVTTTAEMQLERARQEQQTENNCLIA